MQRGSLIVRSIWAVCLLIAAANHARILVLHGVFWDYGGVAWGSAVYWSSLTILDPVVAALLFIRPRAGIVSTVLLIGSNVIHNFAVTAQRVPEGELLTRAASDIFLLSQVAFLLFVAATAPVAWKGAARDELRPVASD